MSALLFGGTRDWHKGTHLADATGRAGLDLAAMESAVKEGGQSHESEVQVNQDALTEAGHWGVPTFVLDGQPYFGQDRIATLRW